VLGREVGHGGMNYTAEEGSAFGSFDYKHEFISGNYTGHKHDLKVEEEGKIVPPKNSKTSQMRDPAPPRNMRVKSGYTGHVPHVRAMPMSTCTHCMRKDAPCPLHIAHKLPR
jgi:hypothetical protein